MSLKLNTQEAELHLSDYLQTIKNRWLEILLTFVVVFASASVSVYMIRPAYQSTARVEIRRPGSDLTAFGSGASASTSAQSMTTLYEMIRSPETLKYLVKKQNLSELWGCSEVAAAQRVAGMMKIAPVTETEFVDISVTSGDPAEAKRLVEGVCEAYRMRREEETKKVTEDALKKIQEEIQEQADHVEDLRHLLNSFVHEQGLLNPLGRGSNQTTEMVEQDFRTAKDKAMSLESSVRELQTQLENLQSMKDEQLIVYSAAIDLPDNTVKRMYPEYQAKVKEIANVKASGLGDNHPRVKGLIADLNNTRSQMMEAVVNLRSNMLTQLEQAKVNKEEWEKVVAEKEAKLKTWTVRQQEFTKVQDEYNTELERLNKMRDTVFFERTKLKTPGRVLVYESYPQEPTSPINAKVSTILVAGAAAGVILGVLLAFFLEYMDTTVKTIGDIEKYVQLPVLGIIPKNVSLLYKTRGKGPSASEAEAYRILRTNIEFSRSRGTDNAMAFVSASPGEGKSTTLTNLAYVCATAGYTVLMIDADMRRPRLHHYVETDYEVGLSNFLTSDMSLEDVVLQTKVENLFLLPSGHRPDDASGLLNSTKMAELINMAKEQFDLVLIDSPPVLGVSDATVLASEVDMVVMVVQPRRLPRQMVIREKAALDAVNANILGVILNNVDINTDHQYQYYTSYYSYYTDVTAEGDGDKTVKKSKSKKNKKADENSAADDSLQVQNSSHEEDIY